MFLVAFFNRDERESRHVTCTYVAQSHETPGIPEIEQKSCPTAWKSFVTNERTNICRGGTNCPNHVGEEVALQKTSAGSRFLRVTELHIVDRNVRTCIRVHIRIANEILAVFRCFVGAFHTRACVSSHGNFLCRAARAVVPFVSTCISIIHRDHLLPTSRPSSSILHVKHGDTVFTFV